MTENKLAYDLALQYAQIKLESEMRDVSVPDQWREMDRLQELFNEAYEHYAYLNEVKLPTYPDGFVPGAVK